MRLSLPRRAGGRPLPSISIVDMRYQKPIGQGGLFSPALLAGLDEALGGGEQALLFLNRRGFSTTVFCRACQWKAQCRRCAIQLTHYLKRDRLLCHYCGHEEAPLTTCPECRFPTLRYGGYGTEKVAEAAARLFPQKRVARMDGETLRGRGAADKLFRALVDGEIDILVGTQILAKGFDIPGIKLVGVVSADTALLIPDFRSAERTFQILCQVAGRTGRGDVPGRVIIQTYFPDHYAIRAAALHDHATFAEVELRHRKDSGYPPFGHMLRVVVQSSKPEEAAREIRRLRDEAAEWGPVARGDLTIYGPAPCPIPLLKGQHRHHLLFRASEAGAITALVGLLPRRSGRRLRILVDRDPVALM
jgi:primosomal protein N' (replication factor Y)